MKNNSTEGYLGVYDDNVKLKILRHIVMNTDCNAHSKRAFELLDTRLGSNIDCKIRNCLRPKYQSTNQIVNFKRLNFDRPKVIYTYFQDCDISIRWIPF